MAKVYDSILDLVGKTPLVELKRIEEKEGLQAKLIAKVESFNPAGSVKDRIAKAMIEDAEAKGLLKEGSVIIEPTSGNTGIGLAAAATVKGYRMILTMPETMSVERRNIVKAYGAEVVLTDGTKGMKGAIEKADELAKEIPNSFIAGQFVNPANPATHKKTTGPEIWEDTDGEVDIFVAGVGTGGTITGTGEYLKEKKPEVKEYTVTATVNNDEMGTAQLNPNASKYKEGTEVTATATVKDESKYEFVNWTSGDEVVSKDAEYTFTVEKDMQLTANFQAKEDPEEPQPPKPPVTEDTFKLNVTVNDDKMGTVKLDPAKVSYEAGETVKAIATAKEGYKFLNWTVDGKVVSDKAEYTFIVDRTVTLKANFAKVSEDPKDKDKAVQTGDNSVSPIIPLAGLMLAAGAAVVALRKKED